MTGRRMRAVLAVLVIVASWLLGSVPVPAEAANATLRVEKQGWFWRHAQSILVDPFSPVEEASGQQVCPLPAGVSCPAQQVTANPTEVDHFMAGYSQSAPQGEREQAISLFQFDLNWMLPGTDIAQAHLRLVESNDDFTPPASGTNPTNADFGHPSRRPSGNVNSEEAEVRACLVRDYWGEAQPGLWGELARDKIDCKVGADGRRSLRQISGFTVPVWDFDLTAIAKVWGRDPFSNFGVALVPKARGEFMVTFHGDTYVVDRDPVTGQDLAPRLVERLFVTMRFTPPPGADDGDGRGSPGGTASPGDTGTSSGGVALDGGETTGAGGPGSGAVQPTPGRRIDSVVRALNYTASVPGYVWLPLPLALVALRLFRQLFAEGRGSPQNRVATLYHRRKRPLVQSG